MIAQEVARAHATAASFMHFSLALCCPLHIEAARPLAFLKRSEAAPEDRVTDRFLSVSAADYA
jgi:CHASE1-domain containing sensor protein